MPVKLAMHKLFIPDSKIKAIDQSLVQLGVKHTN